MEVVYLEVDPRTHVIGRVLLVDPMGNESDLVLDKLVEDAQIKDDAFDIQLPPGVSTRDATTSEGR